MKTGIALLALAAASACATAPTLDGVSFRGVDPAVAARAMGEICLPAVLAGRTIDAQPSDLLQEAAPPPSGDSRGVRASYRLGGGDAFVFQTNEPSPDCHIYVYGGDTAAIRLAMVDALSRHEPPFASAYCGPSPSREAHRDALEIPAGEASWLVVAMTSNRLQVMASVIRSDQPFGDVSQYRFVAPRDLNPNGEATGFVCP